MRADKQVIRIRSQARRWKPCQKRKYHTHAFGVGCSMEDTTGEHLYFFLWALQPLIFAHGLTLSEEIGVSSVVLRCLNEVIGRGTLQMKRQLVWKSNQILQRWWKMMFSPPHLKRTDLLDEKATPPGVTRDSQGCISACWCSECMKGCSHSQGPVTCDMMAQMMRSDGKGFRFQILCISSRNHLCLSRPRVINVFVPQTDPSASGETHGPLFKWWLLND